jgi:hypothetical protein
MTAPALHMMMRWLLLVVKLPTCSAWMVRDADLLTLLPLLPW